MLELPSRYPIISVKSITQQLIWTSGGCLNMKISSYQNRDPYVKDKTVSPIILSLTWDSPYLGKTVFILRRGPGNPRFHIQVPNLQTSCSDLTLWEGIRVIVPAVTTWQHASCLCCSNDGYDYSYYCKWIPTAGLILGLRPEMSLQSNAVS